MPNWCTTNYYIHSSEDKTKTRVLYEKLVELQNAPESILPNGFGKLWLGNVVHLLGGDWEKVYCRGWITEFNLTPESALTLSVESAWGELDEVRNLVLTKYPELEIYYQAEEPGNLYFVTNDPNRRYFPNRYLLDFCWDERGIWFWEYFATLQDAAAFISEKCLDGKPVEADLGRINAALDDWQEENYPDISFFFEEFKLVVDR